MRRRSLFLKWSESTVSRALAILIPGETMPPRYKLTYQDGEEFLIRPANLGVHKVKFLCYIHKTVTEDVSITLYIMMEKS